MRQYKISVEEQKQFWQESVNEKQRLLNLYPNSIILDDKKFRPEWGIFAFIIQEDNIFIDFKDDQDPKYWWMLYVFKYKENPYCIEGKDLFFKSFDDALYDSIAKIEDNNIKEELLFLQKL